MRTLALLLALTIPGLAAADCSSDSECNGGRCRSGKCTTAGGQCFSDSDCPGATCRSGKCTAK